MRQKFGHVLPNDLLNCFGSNPLRMRSAPSDVSLWQAAALICTAATAFSFHVIDMPLAHLMMPISGPLQYLQSNLGSRVLLAVEAVLFFGANFVSLLRDKISPLGKAIAVACATSICAYAINESIVKVTFGIPNPYDVLRGVRHTVHWFSGSDLSSFPSGHMVLASSFAGVIVRFYRASIWPLSALLVVAATLLVAGDWHFLSDVIAGTFLGISAGLAVGKYWVGSL
jgi:membrane-associated phospholipid phosphatase